MKRVLTGIFAGLMIGVLIGGCEQPGGLPEETARESEEREETTEPVRYTVAANGVNGEEDSTALVFTFERVVAAPDAESVVVADGEGENGGGVVRGALEGSGRTWTLGITAQKAGTVTVRIDKEGIEDGEKPVTVFKAGERTVVSYSAAADGGGRAASTRIDFSFGAAVAGLGAEEITVTGGAGSVTKGAVSGGGQAWSLGIAVERAGTVTFKINRAGIEDGEKTVTVYRALGWEAQADGASGTEDSTRIDFSFGGAVPDLSADDISLVDGTGSAFPLGLTGGGTSWSLWIFTVSAGDIRVSIAKDGIDGGKKTVAVYKAGEEASPPDPEPEERRKTGIAIVSPPDITVYARGQAFDTTGLVVAWVYNDQTTETMAAGDYTLTEPDMTRFTPKQITVSAGGFETSFNIQVLDTDQVLSSVSVGGAYRMVQDLGLPFDKTGLVVTGHYSDGSTRTLTNYAAITGYDKNKRGPQAVSVKVNGKTAPIDGIVTRIGEAAAVSVNAPREGGLYVYDRYKNVFIKGQALTAENCDIKLTVKPGGGAGPVVLSYANGGLTQEDIAGISGYNPNLPGDQTLNFTLDGRSFELNVYVIDTESAVWFDYGYMRHDGDPEGAGKGAGIAEGKYYVKPGETAILAPVRYLVGYNADYSDAGASYSWTVSGGSWTTSGGGEFLHFTPSAAGTYDISVSVTGRNFVTGGNVTKTASAKAVCFDTGLPGRTFNGLRNFAPGQFTERGSGYGWSLGAAGGYWVWNVQHRDSYRIEGNAFAGWHEPGIVWAQEDRNGNGLPDETWYELKGPDEDVPARRDRIIRRYAVRYFDAAKDSDVDYYGRPERRIFWSDSKGRCSYMPSGYDFPYDWGVTGRWVTYTCTLLRDKDTIDDGITSDVLMSGLSYYVDANGVDFPISAAMDITGNPVTLTAVRFIKVHTAVFRYGGGFGEISTEIKSHN